MDTFSYGSLVSLARYLYYLADFVLGYWCVIFPSRLKGELVIGERWYYDVLVQPARYGFRLPHWLLRLGGRLVPKPDLVVLFEADPAVIRARKPELTVEAIRDQLDRMRDELSEIAGFVRIDTGGPLVGSVAALLRSIEEAVKVKAGQADTTCRRRDSWRGFPSRCNVKIWVSGGDSLRHAMHLHHPYSAAGRAAGRAAAILPRVLVTRRAENEEWHRLTTVTGLIREVLQSEDAVVSYYCGTKGAHRKWTGQVSVRGTIIAYAKVATDYKIAELLANEADALSKLDYPPFNSIVAPKVLGRASSGKYTVLLLSAPTQPGIQRALDLNGDDIRFLDSLANDLTSELSIDQVLTSICGELSTDPGARRLYLEHPIVNLAREAIEQILRDRPVYTGRCHGDYAPWNTLKLRNGDLYVFDWEYSRADGPRLGDLFHRLYMPARLVLEQRPDHLITRLMRLHADPLAKQVVQKSGVCDSELPAYLLLYLLGQAARDWLNTGTISDYTAQCTKETLYRMGCLARRRRVLVSAYACEPQKGSEPGVGWGWAVAIAKNYDAWVITRHNNQAAIELAMKAAPNPYLHFAYADLPHWVGFWKRGTRGIHLYYYLWQVAALFRARRLQRTIGFDLAHQVTFVNDWMWTFLALLGIPYVWGPLGSHERIPRRLLPHWKAAVREEIRLLVQGVVRWIDPLYWLSAARAQQIICINRRVSQQMPLRWLGRGKTIVSPAIAVESMENALHPAKKPHWEVLFIGRFIPLKAPHLAIRGFAAFHAEGADSQLTLIGTGPEESRLRQLTNELGVADYVKFVSWLPRSKVIARLREADALLFPSLEGGGMVVLEAMLMGLPVVCLDFGGPGTMVTEKTGRLIPTGAPNRVVKGLGEALRELQRDPALCRSLGYAGRQRAEALYSWGVKAKLVQQIYSPLLSEHECGGGTFGVGEP
jgi:glycosyltransferase involved in cell wall biosynthesis